MIRLASALAAVAVLSACQSGTSADSANVPGDDSDTHAWSGIGADEALHFVGTEPFWGGEAQGGELTWETPEDPDGETIAVEHFAGRNGLGLSGTLGGARFEMAVSEAACSDGMSDRTFPFIVTVQAKGQTLHGCGWSDARPFTGPEAP